MKTLSGSPDFRSSTFGTTILRINFSSKTKVQRTPEEEGLKVSNVPKREIKRRLISKTISTSVPLTGSSCTQQKHGREGVERKEIVKPFEGSFKPYTVLGYFLSSSLPSTVCSRSFSPPTFLYLVFIYPSVLVSFRSPSEETPP